MARARTHLALAITVTLSVLSCSDEIPIVGPDGAQLPTAYVNPDPGLPTFNSDARVGSSCFIPDQEDTQRNSTPGSAANNVHIDACLSSQGGGLGNRLDTRVSWDSSGVGTISACPDPDLTGPKTASNTGTRCIQSGFQTRGIAGDNEYHMRANNTSGAGIQTVVFCFDPEGDGCGNATATSVVTINWVQ
jgi:hypothetical protein